MTNPNGLLRFLRVSLRGVDESVDAGLKCQPRSHSSTRSHFRRLGHGRRRSEEFGETQVGLDDGGERRVLWMLEDHVAHLARRSKLGRRDKKRLHEKSRRIAPTLIRSLLRVRIRRISRPDHGTEGIFVSPQSLEQRSGFDGRDVKRLPSRARNALVHRHLIHVTLVALVAARPAIRTTGTVRFVVVVRGHVGIASIVGSFPHRLFRWHQFRLNLRARQLGRSLVRIRALCARVARE